MPVVPPLQPRSTGALTSTGLRSPRGLAWIGRAPEEGAGSPLGTGSFAFSRAPRSSGGLQRPRLLRPRGRGGARHSLPGGRRQASLSCLHALPRRFFLRGLNERNCAEL